MNNTRPDQRRTTRRLLTVAIVAAGAAVPATASAAPGIRSAERPIANQYVVVLKNDVDRSQIDSTASQLNRRHAGKLGHVFSGAVRGFATRMSKQSALELSRDPDVAFVEQDGIVEADVVQTNPPSYGLDRVDQRQRPLDSSYSYGTAGTGVHAYVIDTGLRTSHSEFGGRATNDFDALGGNGVDCNGHGTHVAGTLGGRTMGIAKTARLHGIRVLDCNGFGSISSVVAGVNWVTDHFSGPAVVNMSLGGGRSAAIDTAVQNSINRGLTYVVSAGNSNVDALTQSPAAVPAAITVGSTDRNDTRASDSNFGPGVDVFAPGVQITSSWNGSDTATAVLSGTSMATPLVAGAIARRLQGIPTSTPAENAAWVTFNATGSVVGSPGAGSPNRLLYLPACAYCGTKDTQFADVNGDRRDDAIAISDDGVYVRTSTGSGFGPARSWSREAYWGILGTHFADVNGDGRADAIAIDHNGVYVRLSTGSDFAPWTGINWTQGPFSGSRSTFFADVNGDGRADAIAVNDSRVMVRLSTGSSFGPASDWSREPYWGILGSHFADVNGDRRADAIAIDHNGVYVRASRSYDFSPWTGVNWTQGPFYGSRMTAFADTNGDGRADAIAVNNDGVHVRISNGNSFDGASSWSHEPYYGPLGTRFADVTGDNRADAIALDVNGIYVRPSTGWDFAPWNPVPWAS